MCQLRSHKYHQIAKFIILMLFSCNSTSLEEQIESAYSNGEYDKVIEICNEVLKQDTNYLALNYRARSYFNLNNHDKALIDFTSLYLNGDTSNETLEGLGKSNGLAGQPEIAYKVFQRLLLRNPDSIKYSYYMAVQCFELDKDEEAIQHLVYATNADSTNLKYLYELALMYQKNDNYLESILCFNKILNQSGHECPDTIYYNRSVSYSYIGPIDSCLKDLSRAISCNPNNSDYYYYRALVNMKLGYREACCEDFEAAKRLGYLVSSDDEIRRFCELR